MKIQLKYSATQREKGYTKNEDVFLLHETRRVGYGEWQALRESILSSPEFTFDYYLRSRSGLELSRRVDTLLALLGKAIEASTDKSDNKSGTRGGSKSKRALGQGSEPE